MMGRNSKITSEQKARIVQEYLAGKGSYETLVKQQVGRKTLQDWVRKCQTMGIVGLWPQKQNQSYPTSFKRKVIEEHLTEGNSLFALAEKYQIPSDETVRLWILQYTK